MPPEMIKREPHGLAADIWSFAICIMEVANGHPPNRKSSIRAMFQAGTLGYADPLESKRSQWSAGFDSFLRLYVPHVFVCFLFFLKLAYQAYRCLQVDPTQRATVKNLLAHEWLKKASSKDHMKQLFSEVFLANRLQLDV
jgi:serine/threonine protein kinase